MIASQNGRETSPVRSQSSPVRAAVPRDITEASDDEITNCLERNMSTRRILNFFGFLTQIVHRMESEGYEETDWRQVTRELRETLHIHEKSPLMMIFAEDGFPMQCVYQAVQNGNSKEMDIIKLNRDYHDATPKKLLSLVMITKFKTYARREEEEGHKDLFEYAFQSFWNVSQGEAPKELITDDLIKRLLAAIKHYYREENHLVFRDNTAKYMPFFKKHLQEYGFEVPPELDTPIPDLEPHSDPSPNRSSQLHDISSDIQDESTESIESLPAVKTVVNPVHPAVTSVPSSGMENHTAPNVPAPVIHSATPPQLHLEETSEKPAEFMDVDQNPPQPPSEPAPARPATKDVIPPSLNVTSAPSSQEGSAKPLSLLQTVKDRIVVPQKPSSPVRVATPPAQVESPHRSHVPSTAIVIDNIPAVISEAPALAKVEEPKTVATRKIAAKEGKLAHPPRNTTLPKYQKQGLPTVNAAGSRKQPATGGKVALFQPDVPIPKKSPEPAASTSAPFKPPRPSLKDEPVEPVDIPGPPEKKQKVEEKSPETPPVFDSTSAMKAEAVANFGKFMQTTGKESAKMKQSMKAFLAFLLTEKPSRLADFDAFKLPVSAEVVKEYDDYIKNPLSITKIAEELDKNDMTAMELCNKLLPMAANAMAFNMFDQDVCKVAFELMNLTEAVYQDYSKADEKLEKFDAKKHAQAVEQKSIYPRPSQLKPRIIIEGRELGPRGKPGRKPGLLRKGSTTSSTVSSVKVTKSKVAASTAAKALATPTTGTKRTRGLTRGAT